MTGEMSKNDGERQSAMRGLPDRGPVAEPTVRLHRVARDAVDNLHPNAFGYRAPLLALVTERIDALGARPDEARLALLAELIAVTATKVEGLEHAGDKALASGDVVLAEAAHRALDRAAQRLVAFVREHRIESQLAQRSVRVSVGHDGGGTPSLPRGGA